ncbi:MAG: hypothetical protein AAGD13_01115 [Pseudomonadota bacterium]
MQAHLKTPKHPAPFAVRTHSLPVLNATTEAWAELCAALAAIHRWNDECERLEDEHPDFAMQPEELGKPPVNALRASEHALNVAYDDFSNACARVLACPVGTATDVARMISAARFNLSAPEDIDALTREIRAACASPRGDIQ